MSDVTELLRTDCGTSQAMLAASTDLLAAVQCFLNAGGCPFQVETMMEATKTMIAIKLQRAKRIRRRVRAMMPTQNELKF